uniref:Uncharacterized protein n=1 Tax=Hippocampus comes TaxID=109280 RepID=A0A3Q2XJ12_HIPCM
MGCLEITAACLKRFFDGNPPADQYLCRAFLCQSQLKVPPPTGSMVSTGKTQLLGGLTYTRSHYIVFNASVLYLQMVRPLLQPGRCCQLISSLRQVVKSLELVADKDHSWRAELMMHLIDSLLDAGKTDDAASYARVTEEFIRKHCPHLYSNVFRLQVCDAMSSQGKCQQDGRLGGTMIHWLACLPHSAEVQGSSPSPSCVGFACSLHAFVFFFLRARLKAIGKLNHCLQTALREGDPQAVQAVCATQWSFCLPLLQHNLRRHVKTPLSRVAQALEDIMLFPVRCQVHAELAVTEEEDGLLEASMAHLQKAMLLDNGTQKERLSSAFHLLQLRRNLYQTPSRSEDKAAMLMQQNTDCRPLLLTVGQLLAPADFQMVLNADNISKSTISSSHSVFTSILRLWATLAKTARKQEVWDVCRVAGRFCLLYDEARSKMSRWNYCTLFLGEIIFLIQATAQKLQMQGVQLNSPAVLPQDVGVSEDDPHWIIYRDWIQDLSAYATSTFLRAAELGTQIREPWVVANSAIYLWNYNRHLLVTGDYNCLIPTFQSLVEMFQKTENHALLVLLCDAVARGLYQHLAVPDNMEQAYPQEKGKVKSEKAIVSQAAVLDPDALLKVQKAFELCNYALSISNGNTIGEAVPIAVQKQLVATWAQIKILLQQQTGCQTDTDEKNEEMSPMTRVLIAVEMLQSYKDSSPSEGYDPSLSTLVTMVSNCNWTDAVVELQTWCQLAAFCHHAKEYSLVLSCTERAMQLEDAASKLNEMLSTAACLRGLSSIHESIGDVHIYKTAMDMLLSSVRYAQKAGHSELCFTAARHYWNNCLPLTHSPEERHQLKEPLEAILNALLHTYPKHTNV